MSDIAYPLRPIRYMTKADFLTKKAAGEIPNGQQVFFTDIVTIELQYGSSDPTTATEADYTGFMYQNTTTGDLFVLRTVSVSGDTTVYNWENVVADSNLTAKALRIDGTSQTVTEANQKTARDTIAAVGLEQYVSTAAPEQHMLYWSPEQVVTE